MAPPTRLVAIFCAIALQVGLTASADTADATIDLFVAGLTGSPTIVEASIITVISSLSETQMLISCPGYREEATDAPPCNLLEGATVTVNPTGMTLSLSRETTMINPTGLNPKTTWETSLTETGTVTCAIHGRTRASCTGHATSSGTMFRHPVVTGSFYYGVELLGSTTISEDIGSSGAHTTFDGHTIPVTVTAGLEHLPVPTTTSTGGVPRATALGRGHAVVAVALALALAAGVVLI